MFSLSHTGHYLMRRVLVCSLLLTPWDVVAEPTLAPGHAALPYPAPPPGSYRLPALGKAADGQVLVESGKTTRLHNLMGDKIVLLSFIYTTCSEVNGCPLATSVFHKIKRRLELTPDLAQHFRLLTLSFNPTYDTPEKMRAYAASFQSSDVDWRFLTTASETALQPLLNNYQQNIQKHYDANGHFNGKYSHLLRVYLIDRDKQLRNIYSVDFLHADTLINDVKTILLSAKVTDPTEKQNTQHTPQQTLQPNPLYSAGDYKSGYLSSTYRTRSIALQQRQGKPYDLLGNIKALTTGLPVAPIPGNNPVSSKKIALGKKLFYDRRLSLNNTFSCAMCHIPEQGFSSNEMQTAVGFEGRTVRRNSPSLYNVAYYTALFHDGRETNLEHQVWGPLLAANEMANPSIGYVVEKIKGLDDYQQQFTDVFGRDPGMETIGMAIASYERALISANSAFDRWYYGKQQDALSQDAQKGFELFTGKGRCASCHRLNNQYALFTDQSYHNTGIGYVSAMTETNGTTTVQLAPGLAVEIDRAVIDTVAEPKPNDLGRYEVTQDPADRWKYKTPSLRNIALTAPYMHNGELATLEQVLAFYNRGGMANENLSDKIKPLHLTLQEIQQLIAFLQSLTGDNVEHLVADAYSATIGDAR